MELDSEWLSIAGTDPALKFVRYRNTVSKRECKCSMKSHLRSSSYKNIGLILHKYFCEILCRYFIYFKYQKKYNCIFSVFIKRQWTAGASLESLWYGEKHPSLCEVFTCADCYLHSKCGGLLTCHHCHCMFLIFLLETLLCLYTLPERVSLYLW